MGFENNDGGSVWTNPLPGSEGLRTFWWNNINKFDLQTANDLFERYSVDKDPQTLGKINELHLDVMKRAAEAELAKLWTEGNRAEIEASMNDPRIPKGKLNEHLPYVLVNYLKNVDKLAAERAAATTSVKQETRFLANNLLTTIPQNGQFFDFDALKLSWKKPEFNMSKAPSSGVAERKAETKGATPAPETAKSKDEPKREAPAKETQNSGKEKPAESQTQREERLSAEFVRKERAKIDQLVSKLPNEAKMRISELLKNPTKENVAEIQKTIGMTGKGSQGVDGRFWKNTLAALEKCVEPKQVAEAKWGDAGPEKTVAGTKPAVTENDSKAPTEKPKEKIGTQVKVRLGMALRSLAPAENWAFSLKDTDRSDILFKFEPMKWEWRIKSNKTDWLPVKGILGDQNASETGLKLVYGENGFSMIKNLNAVSDQASASEIQEVLSGLNLNAKKPGLDPNAKPQGVAMPKGHEGWTAAYAETHAKKHPYVLAKDR